jgi:CelD/BcsL family acetyltransferase involved in cellulose biosynthesis
MRIVTATTVEGVRSLRGAWDALGAADVNADLDYFLTVVQTRQDVLEPHVVLAADDGTHRGLLVARLERMVVPVRLGYKQLYAPRLRALTVVQGGLLAPSEAEVAEPLFDAVRTTMAGGAADVVRLRRLRVGSELHRLARSSVPWLTREHHSRPSQRWRLSLPDSLDEVLRAQSTRTRGNHRRYARKLEQEFGPRLTFQVHRDATDLPRVIGETEAVAAKTYQRGLGAGFGADDPDRRLLTLAAERGWLRAYILSVDGAPVAFWHGLAYRGTFFTGPTGYDPNLAHLRLGTYVLMKMIEDLCVDGAVQAVDYGPGEAEYKRHFGSESWLEEDVLVFAPTLRGVRVNLARAAILSAANVAARAAERAPVLQGIKRRWRTRLSSDDGAEPEGR